MSSDAGNPQLVDRAAGPVQLDLRAAFRNLNRADRDRFDRDAQHRLAIRRAGRRRVPDAWKITSQRAHALTILAGQRHATLTSGGFVALSERFEFFKTRLPLAFQRPRHHAVVGI
jgi:hypothetical protein